MRSLGEERTGDVTGVSVSNWLMSPPGDFAVNSPGDPPKSGLPAIALAPPPGDAPPLTGVPWNPNTSNSSTSLYRLCVEFRVTSASFSSPKDLPSVRRMDLRRLDFAAETCSFVRSDPYRDGGGALRAGFFGDVDGGDLAIARTSSSPKENVTASPATRPTFAPRASRGAARRAVRDERRFDRRRGRRAGEHDGAMSARLCVCATSARAIERNEVVR